MKLNKKIAIVAIIAATSLLATTQSVESIVDQINKTTDAGTKGKLMKKLDKELETMNDAEQKKAYVIINSKLKKPTEIN